MNESQEVSSGFFVAGGDSTKMLDAVYEAFDLVAAAVLSAQQASRDCASRPRGDHRRAAAAFDLADERVAVVPFVRDQVMGIVFGQQAGSLGHVVGLSRREAQFDWTPRRFHGDV